jgi:hypothetical protein
MKDFIKSLKSIERVMYKSSYDFHIKYFNDATPESAHEAGLKSINKLDRLRKEESKPKTMVDLSTGKTFKAII